MLYRKNVGSKEAIARFIAGALMIACGLVGLQGSPLGMLLVATGVTSLATGLFGYCPACALAGRKPVQRQ